MDLDTFVTTEYPKVVAAVGLITGNRQDAADAVQDAIVGFLAKPPSRPITNVAAWITVVASNRARDLQRSKGAEARALAKVGVDDESTDDALNSLDALRSATPLTGLTPLHAALNLHTGAPLLTRAMSSGFITHF